MRAVPHPAPPKLIFKSHLFYRAPLRKFRNAGPAAPRWAPRPASSKRRAPAREHLPADIFFAPSQIFSRSSDRQSPVPPPLRLSAACESLGAPAPIVPPPPASPPPRASESMGRVETVRGLRLGCRGVIDGALQGSGVGGRAAPARGRAAPARCGARRGGGRGLPGGPGTVRPAGLDGLALGPSDPAEGCHHEITTKSPPV